MVTILFWFPADPRDWSQNGGVMGGGEFLKQERQTYETMTNLKKKKLRGLSP
jgi:hypothetical protein